MATTILDNFADSNTVPLASHTIGPTNTVSAAWSVPSGTYTIESAKAVPAHITDYNYAVLDSTHADGTISVVVRRSGACEAYLLFRYTNQTNWYGLAWESATGDIKLYKVEAGSATVLDTDNKTFATATDYTLQIVLSGNSIVGTIDGGNTVNGSNAFNNTATKHGFIGSPGAAVLTFDNFQTDDATAGGTATAFTLTGPSAGPQSAPSANFTVTPDGTTSGTFTPDAASGCSFSPSSLTWTGDDVPKTFTVTKTTLGTVQINGTFSDSLTPPADVDYTAKATAEKVFVLQDGTPGSTTINWAIKNLDGTFFSERTDDDVVDQGNGAYSVLATIPADRLGLIQWDDDEVDYAYESLATDGVFERDAPTLFTFEMRDATTGALLPWLTPTARRTIDGGALADCANDPEEISDGAYSILLEGSDEAGKVIGLLLEAEGAKPVYYTIITGVGIEKGVALDSFVFAMFDEEGQPAPGLTVTAKRTLDGGAVEDCENAVSEISDAWYKLALDVADVAADDLLLLFEASGAQPTTARIRTVQ